MKFIHLVIVLFALSLLGWAQTEKKNDLGLLLGAGFIPQRTTAGGEAIDFGASIAFSANYARQLKGGDTSFSLEFPFVAEPSNNVQSTDSKSIVALATIFVVPSLRVKFWSNHSLSPWLSGGVGYGIWEGGEFFDTGSKNPTRYQSTAALQFGVGVDIRTPIKVLFPISLRGEVRDFYSLSIPVSGHRFREVGSTMLSYRVEWYCTSRRVLAAIPFLSLVLAPAAATSQRVAIDKAHSTVTVHVYKSGLLSGLAHNHVIHAPVASGSVDAKAGVVELSFNVADMKVLDPDASDSERQEIEVTMKGPKVLDPAQFPVINFLSTGVSNAGPGPTQVRGTLKLHGSSRQVTVPVVLQDGKYSGSITLKQTDYGITPVKIAGGAVRVKDEIMIEFQVAPQ